MGIFDVFARKDAEYYKTKFYESNEIYQKARQAMADGNKEKGFKLYCKAAKGYNYMAKYMVAFCYEAGMGVDKSNPKAFELYSELANETFELGDRFSNFMNRGGIGLARFRTALFLQNGWDVPIDTAKSTEILSKINADRDSAEVAFFAAVEMQVNYHHGKNGCSQDFRMSHIYALRGLEVFDKYKRDAELFNFVIEEFSLNNHRALLQYAAYNNENGRGVPKDLDKAIRYRQESLKLYNLPEDAYWAGMDYYALENIDKAEEMFKIARKTNNKDWQRWANEKLDEINTARNAEYKKLKEAHLKAVEDGDERAILREAGFRAWGRRRFNTGKLFGYVSKKIPADIDSALNTVLDMVKKDVVDNTPLPAREMKLLYTTPKQEVYKRYAIARIIEKAGQNFMDAVNDYVFNTWYSHGESTFRREQLGFLVTKEKNSTIRPYEDTKKTRRPVYNTLSEPTFALVQLAERQDPEAIVDLARIYEEKKNYDICVALRIIAGAIYSNRADAGDPEAMYNLACIVSEVQFDFRAEIFKHHYLYYLHLAYLYKYGKVLADYSSNSFFFSPKDREKMREEANSADANAYCYFPYLYTNKDTFEEEKKKAVRTWEKWQKQRVEKPDDPAVIKRGYFEKVFNFVESRKDFTDPEMLQFIADGVIDGLGDVHLAQTIKQAAVPLTAEERAYYEEIRQANKKALMDSFRKNRENKQ